MGESLINIVVGILTILGFVFGGNRVKLIVQGIQESRSEDEYEAETGRKKRNAGVVGVLGALLLIALLFVFAYWLLSQKDNSVNGSTMSTETTGSSITENTKITEILPSENYVVEYLYLDGDVYTGYINDFGKPDGEGKMVYIEGDIYDGEWKNGLRNGKGTYTWNSGAKYVGDFVDDVREGKGDFLGFVDSDGRYSGDYHGEFKNNQFEGEGTFEFTNGEKFVGVFKENQRWDGVQYDSNDEILCVIKNGEPMP